MSALAVVAALAGQTGQGPGLLSVSSVWSVSQAGWMVTEPLFWLVAGVLLAGALALGIRAGHAGINPRALWRNERDLRRPGRIWARYARVLLAAGLLTGACALGAALVVLVVGVGLVAGAGALVWYWLRLGADWVEPRTSAADRRILGQPDPYPYLREPAHDDLPGDLPGDLGDPGDRRDVVGAVLGEVAELSGPPQTFERARPPGPAGTADPAPPPGGVVVVTRNPKET
ncbi:hypothetical protein ACIHFD_57595 [Nonomuraea sp. NPDC051941]|uniref:hypothetical protein n=1 Tax=Nonomuraea sp. NPDC051941 TaxID=3364373 RepID=UPI0037C7B031